MTFERKTTEHGLAINAYIHRILAIGNINNIAESTGSEFLISLLLFTFHSAHAGLITNNFLMATRRTVT